MVSANHNKAISSQNRNLEVSWHALSTAEVFERLDSRGEGLRGEEVVARQKEFGLNLLPTREPPSVFTIFLHQFLSPLIYVLLAAAVITLLIGELTDSMFIFAVLLLNAAIGTFQEHKAEQGAAALQKLLKIQSRVRRDRAEQVVPAEELVPGDVVFLESGNQIPADIRLTEANSLTVDESLLTGESLATEKASVALNPEVGVSERTCMTFAGSIVTSGRGRGVVVSTGLRTEVGKIAQTVTATEATKPPLVMRMEKLSRDISYVILGGCTLLAGIMIYQGVSPAEVFFLAVAMAVSAIPEGLPVALTVVLSIATARMARRHVIVRRLTAVESLGSCTIIASDKTGTLTVNQQTVKAVYLPTGEHFSISGEGYSGEGSVTMEQGEPVHEAVHMRLQDLARAAILCNEGQLEKVGDGKWRHSGDAMDVALLVLAWKLGLDPSVVRDSEMTLGEIPYESERKYAAKFYQTQGQIRVAAKGAVETVLAFCETMTASAGTAPLDSERIEQETHRLLENGYRVLAVAEGSYTTEGENRSFGEENIKSLTLLGLVGFIDPFRPEAKDAVEECKQAGVAVAMVTGDHPATALFIARQLGIAGADDEALTGQELETLACGESLKCVQRVVSTNVFARVTPIQKLVIVEALQEAGHFVAVTGDGVNDAPALRRANIGVAMGSGTDVAKDTGSMIITDDNFSSIVAGIEEGRFAYDNIRKVVYLLISTGAAELILFTLAIFLGLPLPLLAVQLLWLNLVTNGIQGVALAFEGGEAMAMSRPPRKPREGIFNRLMIQEVLVSGLTMGLITMGAWYALLNWWEWEEVAARNMILLLMVFLQNLHVFNCRSEYVSAFKVPMRRNRFLVIGVVLALCIHLLALHAPFTQELLRASSVSFKEVLILVLLATTVVIVMEIFKAVNGPRQNQGKG
jgi:magnesium-transporting ATPase (P-type)